MQHENGMLCPVCRNKTRQKIRTDAERRNFPPYCPNCKQETLNISVIREPEAEPIIRENHLRKIGSAFCICMIAYRSTMMKQIVRKTHPCRMACKVLHILSQKAIMVRFYGFGSHSEWVSVPFLLFPSRILRLAFRYVFFFWKNDIQHDGKKCSGNNAGTAKDIGEPFGHEVLHCSC